MFVLPSHMKRIALVLDHMRRLALFDSVCLHMKKESFLLFV